MLNIDGKYETSHILGDMIAREYAFCCFWEDGMRLKVAHHKGTWVLARFRDDTLLIDRLEATDALEFQTDSRLLDGLVKSFNEREPQEGGDTGGRRRMGRILTKTIGIWVSPVEEIKKITVLQDGRNSWLDSDGEFSFSKNTP